MGEWAGGCMGEWAGGCMGGWDDASWRGMM